MTDLRTAAQQALESLEIGYDSAQAEAHQFHAAMAGYRPQRHAEMDADVQKIARAITALRAALAEPVQEPVACLIGTKGSAFDSPTTKRAYTYAEQPGNVVASRLGLACNAAASQSAGDSIDRGLGLLQELQRQGFGVFDLGAEYAAPPQRPAEPVQDGCDHCNHPMYAAIKCKVCGRAT